MNCRLAGWPLYHAAQGQTARPVRYQTVCCGPSASFGLALACAGQVPQDGRKDGA